MPGVVFGGQVIALAQRVLKCYTFPGTVLTCKEVCQVIAEESLAVLKDPVATPGMQQKLVQKHAFVVHKQEIKVPTKVYIYQTPRTATPTNVDTSLPTCDTRVSYDHEQVAQSLVYTSDTSDWMLVGIICA